jgi:uncharacterized membrane protein
MQTQTLTFNQPRFDSDLDAGWQPNDEGLRPRAEQGWKNGESIRSAGERRAKFLGVFSLALGISQLTVPGYVARLIGLRDNARSRAVLRALGAREVASGIGLLSDGHSAGFAWSRVAGDAMDLALLGASFGAKPQSRALLAAATTAVAGVAAYDVFSAAYLSRNESVQKLVLPIHVVRSITINRPPEVVYQFWRQLENLPRFMAHLESVRNENGTSIWRAKGPAGTTIEWHAEVTLDRPNEAIAWRSLEGASVPNRGVVRFKPGPGGRGTELLVELKYDPPGGTISAAIAKLFGEEPGQQIAGDLRRLKQVLETGSVVHSDASIHRGLHPARPAAEDEHTVILGKTEVEP